MLEELRTNLKSQLARYRTILDTIKTCEWLKWGLKFLHLQKGSNTSLIKCLGYSCQFVGNTEE